MKLKKWITIKFFPRICASAVKILFLVILFSACKNAGENSTEIIQKHRDNILDVGNEIKDIETDLFFVDPELKIIGNYLMVNDWLTTDTKQIHLYNKNTFEFVTSTGFRGRGPGEISNPGRIVAEPDGQVFWAPDHGKRILYKFYLDSVLKNPNYLPGEKRSLNDELFVERYDFLNDSIALGKAVHVLNFNSFDMAMAKMNINSNTTEKFGYEHPEATGKKSNSFFALSLTNNYYVNAFLFLDLMTICTLDGTLKCNIYGPGYLNDEGKRNSYFQDVAVWDDKIIASYNGGADMIYDEKGNPLHGAYPSKFLVFDSDGNYLKTLDPKSQFSHFCVDKENQRLVVYFEERVNPLGYINLKTLEL